MPEFQGLTQAAENLLVTGRSDYRLTTQHLLQLRRHIKMIASWADRIPQKTSFYFVSWQPVLVLPRIEGYPGILEMPTSA
jgi:aminopeptidase-like protein